MIVYANQYLEPDTSSCIGAPGTECCLVRPRKADSGGQRPLEWEGEEGKDEEEEEPQPQSVNEGEGAAGAEEAAIG